MDVTCSDPAPVVDGVARGVVVLAEMRELPLSVDECLAAVRRPEVGGIGLFVGTVRDHDHGRSVADLEYSAHPRAADELARVAADVAAELGVHAIAVLHRTGRLAIGDIAVVVAVGAVHRAEALTACRRLIDDVKEQVPIWKRQAFADGATEWVGAC
ncbi:molybdenum cofactor biosynthesis protein MoaE [Parafrankia discariae]|uniref:molybdenum cofactor biosynthesis protein MoaE n=1 Tax=Parafrankia discariae TaxID=365528 RepID=UPI000476A89C|nr:molybdenum cofactor biosynthesis protein MoaE [Parafrankia discariae]